MDPQVTAATTPESATTAPASAAARIAAMRAGDRRALASAVTELVAETAHAPALIQAMLPDLGTALVLGITAFAMVRLVFGIAADI